MIRLTIGISHFMRFNLLMNTCGSIEKNLSIPYKIIIINDGEPIDFLDETIYEVYNYDERLSVGKKKRLASEFCDTEYFMRLDNDILVQPNSIEFLIQTLDEHPELGCASGLRHEFPGVADFTITEHEVVKKHYSFDDILGRDLFYADFIPDGYTVFRKKVFDDAQYDDNYLLGYSHWDIMLQLYYTEWKCAVHTKSWFRDMGWMSGDDYLRMRQNRERITKSRRYFVEKWGLEPVIHYEK